MGKRKQETGEFVQEDMAALGLSEFDPADYLDSKETIAAYMSEVLASGDAELFQSAMNDVIRAYGMGRVAREAKLTREGAYKALREGSKPRFATVLAMLDAIGMRVAIIPKESGNNPPTLAT